MLKLPIPFFFRVDTPFTVLRKTDFVVDVGDEFALVAGPDRQPDAPAKLLTTVTSGVTLDFPQTITYSGTDEDDAAIAEIVSFTDNGFKITSKSFKTITVIGLGVPGSFTGATTYQTQARARGNEPIFSREPVITGFNPSFQPTTNLIDKIRFPTSGIEEEAHGEIYFNRDEFTPILRDIFSSPDLGDWEVIHIATWLDSHYKLRAKRL